MRANFKCLTFFVAHSMSSTEWWSYSRAMSLGRSSGPSILASWDDLQLRLSSSLTLVLQSPSVIILLVCLMPLYGGSSERSITRKLSRPTWHENLRSSMLWGDSNSEIGSCLLLKDNFWWWEVFVLHPSQNCQNDHYWSLVSRYLVVLCQDLGDVKALSCVAMVDSHIFPIVWKWKAPSLYAQNTPDLQGVFWDSLGLNRGLPLWFRPKVMCWCLILNLNAPNHPNQQCKVDVKQFQV